MDDDDDDDDNDFRCPNCHTVIDRARAIFAQHCPVCGAPLPPPPGVVPVPPLGDRVVVATLIKWHVADGASVQAGQPVCELETKKANVDINAPIAGTLTHLKAEGDTVKIGERIADIS